MIPENKVTVDNAKSGDVGDHEYRFLTDWFFRKITTKVIYSLAVLLLRKLILSDTDTL